MLLIRLKFLTNANLPFDVIKKCLVEKAVEF
jgi:hypothetical protein